MTMAKGLWLALMAVASVSPDGWNGDAAVAAARIEKVDLRMKNVSARYGGRQLVDGMSMSVRRGEVVGLLGTKGAGKSTAWSIMLRPERLSEGSVLLGTMDITSLSLPHRARLGINDMTRESSVFRGLSVHDNIWLIPEETGVPRALHAHRVQEVIEEFSLQVVENTMGRALWGGDRHCMELAQALASTSVGGPPKVLLVNEPFAGVDPIGVAEIQRRFCDEEDLGVLIRDHNVKEMLRICDRACMVHHGCVVASGGAEELYSTTCT